MKRLLFITAIYLSISTFLLTQHTVMVSKVSSPTAFETTTGLTITLLGLDKLKSEVVTRENCTEHLRMMIEGQSVVLMPQAIVV